MVRYLSSQNCSSGGSCCTDSSLRCLEHFLASSTLAMSSVSPAYPPSLTASEGAVNMDCCGLQTGSPGV